MANTEQNKINPINESEKKTFSKKFPLPDNFDNRFPVRRNPIHDSSPLNEWTDWVFKYSLMTPKQFGKVQGIGLMCAHVFGFVSNIEIYEILYKYWTLIFVQDDHVECDYGDIGGRKSEDSINICMKFKLIFKKFENKDFVPIVNWPPYVTGLFAALEPVYNSFNPVQKVRMCKTWNKYFDGVIEEQRFTGSGKQFQSVQEYLNMRLMTIGVDLTIQMFEFCYQMYVPEHIWESKKWQLLLHLAQMQMICVNDIISFEKEFAEQKDDLTKVINLVAVISKVDKIEIRQAMDKVVVMMRDIEKDLLQTENDILSDQDCPPEIKSFIDKLNYMLGGHHASYASIDRYTRVD